MRKHEGPSRRFIDLFSSETVADYHIAGRRLKFLADQCRTVSQFDQLLAYLEQSVTDKHTGACLVAHAVHVSGALSKRAARLHAGLRRVQSLMVNMFVPTACKYLTEFKDVEVANLLWSITKLQVDWTELDAANQIAILNAVTTNLTTMSARDVSVCWWAMAKIGVNWRQLPPKLQRALIKALVEYCASLEAQDCAHVLQAMALMRVSNNRATQQLLPVLFERIFSLETQVSDELATCFAFHASKHLFDLSKVDISRFETNVRAHIHGNPSQSQKAIQAKLQALLGAPFILLRERFLHDTPVDILCELRRMIVEVDGPHHLVGQKQRSDRARDYMRALDGYTTIRIDLIGFGELSKSEQQALLESVAMAIKTQSMHCIVSDVVTVTSAIKKTKPRLRITAKTKPVHACDDGEEPDYKRSRTVHMAS